MFRTADDRVTGTVQKFGRNAAVTTGEDDIWALGGTYPFQQAALPLRVKVGGSVLDVDTTGIGARTIRIEGLDATGAEISEDIALAGASASADTTQEFLRVNRAYVLTTGVYGGSNIGLIDIETNAGVTLARIVALEGQTQMAIYSVPKGKEGHITHVTGRLSAAGVLSLRTRSGIITVAAPFTPSRIRGTWNATSFLPNPVDVNYDAYIDVPELTDIWFVGDAVSATIDVTVQFDVALTG